MKRHIFMFIAVSIVLAFNLSFQTMAARKGYFNPLETKTTAEYLSSPAFKGRLAGTLENRVAAEYIKTWFVSNGLKPYKDGYYQSFDVLYPKKVKSDPYLKVLDSKGKVIHEYTYAVDFKEDMLNFKKNEFYINKGDSIHSSKDVLSVVEDNTTIIFYIPDESDLSFRSSFIADSEINMCIMVTKNTLDEIKDYISKGYSIKCYIPFETHETSVDNIIGVYKGRNKDKAPIILSAHFDHLGTDLNGSIYSGALDNASGTAFMLQMIKYITSLGQPERDIVFIGFNAEEFGCLGSKAFVDKYKSFLSGSIVFNFDMIGSDNGIPLCIMGGKKDTDKSPLIKSAASVCINKKINFNYLFEDASDHEYFRKNGIDAITFCDNDMSKIHTPSDKSESLSITAIERCFDIISKEVIKYGYGDDPLLLFDEDIFLYSFIALSSLILFGFIYSTIKSSSKEHN